MGNSRKGIQDRVFRVTLKIQSLDFHNSNFFHFALRTALSKEPLTVASFFLSFERHEVVFWAFRPEDEGKHSNDPQECP